MEIDNVLKALQKIKPTLHGNARRCGEMPTDRKSLRQLIDMHIMTSLSPRMITIQSSQNFVYSPSIKPLRSLTKIFIKDLRLEMHHRGYSLLLRAMTPSTTMTAVIAVMEDEKRDGITIQLYQQEEGAFIGEKSVCILKEPNFRIMNDGEYALRVDHVNDIIWLAENDDRVPLAWRPRATDLEKSAMQWKDEGNAAMRDGKLDMAVTCYTAALCCPATPEEKRMFKLNRSLARLRLHYYDGALEDATSLGGMDQTVKGFYRAARSLYELGRFSESREAFTKLLAIEPSNDAAKIEITRAERRLEEEAHGNYDFVALYKNAKATPPRLDNATYIGPVAIKPSEGRGRGLFVTKDVVAGELLLCEKAFSYCFSDGGELSLSLKTLIMMIVQKIRRNPSFLNTFTSLHHGDYKAVPETHVDEIPVIDTYLINKIVSLNGFGCPRTTLESYFSKSPENSQLSSGIFIHASHINHKCNSNAKRSFIGDLQIVRATRNLSAGTEIYFGYVDSEADDNHHAKTEEKLKTWGFKCTCEICSQSASTKVETIKKRNGLFQDFWQALGRDTPDEINLAKAERILNAIEKTYGAAAEQVPRLSLWAVYLPLVQMYMLKGQLEKTIEVACRALASLGFAISRSASSTSSAHSSSSFQVEKWGLMTGSVIEAFLYLWNCYMKMAAGARSPAAEEAEKCARIAYKIWIGEDETFEERYGKPTRAASRRA